ncbi:hypothetical protein [Vibrio sp. ABG19]|uniref:hypothetical protein n=1 Tax=Vibrio sp. ABG19 TaxID=2817385 RepID=UPI00249E974A|nr:hypothetical protein [Vibrio sp. ABG19]WGY45823.1 hypothetical protein J0X00_02955 [Vibrio sp. ABG19]
MRDFDEIFDLLPNEFDQKMVDQVANMLGFSVQCRDIYKQASLKYLNKGMYWDKCREPKKVSKSRIYIGSEYRFKRQPIQTAQWD